MDWKNALIREFAGPPLQVGLSILIMALGGILVGHLLFAVPLSPRLVAGALTPPLLMVVTAGLLKAGER